MQGLSHYMQDFARGGIFSSCMGSFRFRFALSSLVRSFTCRHSSSSFPIAPLHSAFCRTLSLWCYRYGGNAAPYTPFYPPSIAAASIKKNRGILLGGFGFSLPICPKQIGREKRTRAPLTISWLKSAVCKEAFPLLNLSPKTANMKQSKKGACSSNTQTAKANCLAHNRRDQSTEKVPDYVNKSRSYLNRTIFEDEIIKGKKSIIPLVRAAEKLYTEKTGQKCQKSFAPFREACLHLKEGITDAQLLDFKDKVEKETKWKVIGIWLHEDEGHVNSKYIEGNEDFSVNHHAHVLFSCQDLNTGKAIRADRTKLSHMQDLLAEATGMERGNRAPETGRTHRSAMEQRIFSQEQRIKAAEKKMLDIKKDLADANNLICPESYNWEDDQEEFELKEMVEYFQEDIEEAKNEALDAQKQLSERQIELENTNLSLSKAQKELLAINSTLEEQKRLISQKNAEIEELKALAEKSNEYKELLQNITESLCRGQLLREIIDGREKGIRCIIDLYKDPHARYFSEEQKQEIAEVIGEDKDLVRSYRAKELIIAASRFIISHGLEEDNHDKNIKGQIEAIVQGKEYREQKRGLKI